MRHFEAYRCLCIRRRSLRIAARTAHDSARGGAFASLDGMITTRVPFCRAITQERASILQTFLGSLPIQLETLRLVDRALIPIHTQPTQTINDSLHQLGLIALCISIFNAENQDSILAARKQPVEQRGTRTAYVEVAGWGRSEPHTDAFVRCLTHCRVRCSNLKHSV